MAATDAAPRRVAVVGGGWAGLAAARELLDRGCRVTLVERLRRPGGRAFSFTDAGTGFELDNGQHVLIGCCDRFRALLARLGEGDSVAFQPLLRVPVACEGRWSTLGGARLPGGLHLLPSLLAYGHLSAAERRRALRVAAGFARPGSARAAETFAQWLRRFGQSERAIERLWDLIGVSFLNCRAREASARLAVSSLRIAFLGGPAGSGLGLFRKPLGRLGEAALADLERGGAAVRLGVEAAAVEVEGGAARGVRLAGGGRLAADAVVCAVPPARLLGLLPGPWRAQPVFAAAGRLRWSPIFNLYLLYDRPVLRGDLAAFAGGPLQFAFNRGRILGDGALDGRLVGLSVSAAADETSVDVLDGALRRALPAAAEAGRIAAVPVWQRQATFLGVPGVERQRPGPASPVAGLYLAGDWTDTGWPACLEGAVRSGAAAARLAAAPSRSG